MTAHHLHHVPGRFRIRVPALKRNRQLAARTEKLIKLLPGVASVHANPLTGSVLVYYNPQVTNQSNTLDDAGVNSVASEFCPSSLEGQGLQAKIAQAVLWYTVEKIVERSVPLLIAAIL